MYLGIDIGGTKTIVAVLDEHGVITESQRFMTPQDYQTFLSKLSETVDTFTTHEFIAIGAGVPATSIDRVAGIAIAFSNLSWQDEPIQSDLERLFKAPAAIENDAKLAGLSEAMLRDPMRLLYLTISTGIGYSLVVDRKIDANIGDGGGRLLRFEHEGKLTPWEYFASGRAIVETYGKQAKDIEDPDIWDKIARNITVGLIELIAMCEPDIVVVGGSVGAYLDRFIKPLKAHLKSLETPLLKIPPVEEAKRPEDAVIYGCYDYVKGILSAGQF